MTSEVVENVVAVNVIKCTCIAGGFNKVGHLRSFLLTSRLVKSAWFNVFHEVSVHFLHQLFYSDASYLLLSEQLRVHHFDLDGNQSEGLECQTTPVSVVILNTKRTR